jgi:histidinol phosphatase-like PHP family hydrolase
VTIKTVYHTTPKSTDPIKQVHVSNSEGYLDLIVNKSANGKAVRINSRDGEFRVNVTLDKVDSLIEALRLVKARGVKLSVNDIEFNDAA